MFLEKTTRRAFAGLLAAMAATAQREKLSEAVRLEKLEGILLPREDWQPFPRAAEREPWEALPAELRARLVEAGERHGTAEWPALPATLFLEYARKGNRSDYEHARELRRARLRELVIAECVEGKGRFLDDILNGVWITCEETWWGVPAHLNMQKAGTGLPDAAEPVVDLFAAETASLLAWTDYLLGAALEKLSALARRRILLEEDRRILTPCFERVDFWWMGLDPERSRDMNNWNPWINSNWLTAVLLLEQDSARRAAAVHKIVRSLDRFLDAYHDDGGCDEGPSYWGRAGASLFDCLELLYSATRGLVDFYRMPLVMEIGRYIYRAHIAEDWYINFADASAKQSAAGDLIYRYGKRIGDAAMQAFGAYAAVRHGALSSRAESIGRQLPALFNAGELRPAKAAAPLVRDVWLPGIQVTAARVKEGSAEGFYLAAQGGHNAESHNHNDVGNFVIFADGRPVIVDAGVETYSAKTFSAKRYEIWTMHSGYHNLPTIDGFMQQAGRDFAARDVSHRADDKEAVFSLDIAAAYPGEAGLDSWRRTLRLRRAENEVELTDRYALKKPPSRIAWTLMTPCEVRESAGGLLLDGTARGYGKAKVTHEGLPLKPKTELVRIDDARLRPIWGERLYRILLTAEQAPREGEVRLRFLRA